jgi:hypothetical protein
MSNIIDGYGIYFKEEFIRKEKITHNGSIFVDITKNPIWGESFYLGDLISVKLRGIPYKKLTEEEIVEIYEFAIKEITEYKDRIKRKVLIEKLAGLKDNE